MSVLSFAKNRMFSNCSGKSLLLPVLHATRENLLEGTRDAVLAPALTSFLNSPFDFVGVPVHVADVARAHVDAVDKALIPGISEYILCSDTRGSGLGSGYTENRSSACPRQSGK